MSFAVACARSELAPGKAVRAEVGERELCIVQDESGTVHALDDICTHGDVSLSEGEVEGCTIECWGHGSRFDLTTGEPQTPPAWEPVRVYPVSLEGEDVLVDIDNPINPST
ncbi:non-heme iron oxygenase ferredoxin subunit [Sediminivirga luteola]|uniref:Non-heme iron oxygenase ferredoxin subunit n=1 Tax=Sediminivirga luteola TaxID=1774748 RepID=A0A8J2TZV4_9MICO|nr:non-heme iron oxygenase ferredoxin subunit [Sediminivirga luteola]MCI2264078.1 non-heme iron oxygenase ferredoxin subunit [Sediminivirga luteola]GGA22538.1 non-heme iron oxygenase ferredoxin subunit [Sediminivirga luteola]